MSTFTGRRCVSEAVPGIEWTILLRITTETGMVGFRVLGDGLAILSALLRSFVLVVFYVVHQLFCPFPVQSLSWVQALCIST